MAVKETLELVIALLKTIWLELTLVTLIGIGLLAT